MLTSSSVALLELNLIVASLERACPGASYYRVYTNHLRHPRGLGVLPFPYMRRRHYFISAPSDLFPAGEIGTWLGHIRTHFSMVYREINVGVSTRAQRPSR
jgi:hypothetical protein